jgi:hypothetical protein
MYLVPIAEGSILIKVLCDFNSAGSVIFFLILPITRKKVLRAQKKLDFITKTALYSKCTYIIRFVLSRCIKSYLDVSWHDESNAIFLFLREAIFVTKSSLFWAQVTFLRVIGRIRKKMTEPAELKSLKNFTRTDPSAIGTRRIQLRFVIFLIKRTPIDREIFAVFQKLRKGSIQCPELE